MHSDTNNFVNMLVFELLARGINVVTKSYVYLVMLYRYLPHIENKYVDLALRLYASHTNVSHYLSHMLQGLYANIYVDINRRSTYPISLMPHRVTILEYVYDETKNYTSMFSILLGEDVQSLEKDMDRCMESLKVKPRIVQTNLVYKVPLEAEDFIDAYAARFFNVLKAFPELNIKYYSFTGEKVETTDILWIHVKKRYFDVPYLSVSLQLTTNVPWSMYIKSLCLIRYLDNKLTSLLRGGMFAY